MRICDKCIHDKVCLLSKSRANCELFDEKRPHGVWRDYSDMGFVECPFCEHATTCNDDIDELHFCFFCGASMRKEGETE